MLEFQGIIEPKHSKPNLGTTKQVQATNPVPSRNKGQRGEMLALLSKDVKNLGLGWYSSARHVWRAHDILEERMCVCHTFYLDQEHFAFGNFL